MIKSILTITFLSILVSTGAFSKDKVNGKQSAVYKTASEKESADKQNNVTKKSVPTTVKYIWKDMPSFDKYGNEITPRMRENMRQNAELEKAMMKNARQQNQSETITESREVK